MNPELLTLHGEHPGQQTSQVWGRINGISPTPDHNLQTDMWLRLVMGINWHRRRVWQTSPVQHTQENISNKWIPVIQQACFLPFPSHPMHGLTRTMTKKLKKNKKKNRKDPVDFHIQVLSKHNNLDPGASYMSCVRRKQKLYSGNTHNKQVYILVGWVCDIYNFVFLKMMQQVHKRPIKHSMEIPSTLGLACVWGQRGRGDVMAQIRSGRGYKCDSEEWSLPPTGKA